MVSSTKSHPTVVKVDWVFMFDVDFPTKPTPQEAGLVGFNVVSQNDAEQSKEPLLYPKNP